MHEKDEELLERLAKEAVKEGLEFIKEREPSLFHKLISRLIETSPSPKQKSSRRRPQK